MIWAIGWSAMCETATPTETDTASGRRAAQVERAHGGPDAFGDLQGAAQGRVAQQDGELLAPEAGRDVVVADRAADRVGNGAEHLVAGRRGRTCR